MSKAQYVHGRGLIHHAPLFALQPAPSHPGGPQQQPNGIGSASTDMPRSSAASPGAYGMSRAALGGCMATATRPLFYAVRVIVISFFWGSLRGFSPLCPRVFSWRWQVRFAKRG
jgi:hypothetical protein